MAGNKKVYDESIRMAQKLAGENNWPSAVKAYRTALQEFPDDAIAIAGVGDGYFALDQYASAVRAYQRALKIDNSQVSLWTRLGQALEALERPEEAIKTYLYAGNVCAKAGKLNQAVENWERVIQLDERNIQARNNVVQAYVRQDKKYEAMLELFEIAALYQEANNEEKAIQSLRGAVQLRPDNRQLKAAMRALENGMSIRSLQAQITELTTIEEKEGLRAPNEEEDFLELFGDFTDEDDEDESGNLREQGRQQAMEDLANIIFEGGEHYQGLALSKSQIDALVGQALEQQTRSRIEEAINTYQQLLEGGLKRASIHFALATLYMRANQFREAAQHFSQASQDANYKLSATFALGECFQRGSNLDQALKYFVETLKQFDLRNVVETDYASLNQLYDDMYHYLTQQADSHKKTLAASLAHFLAAAEPQKNIKAARNFLSNGDLPSVPAMVEFLEAPNQKEILVAMNKTSDYIKKQWYMTAGEECYLAIQQSPGYLPLHLRLAEIYMHQDYLESAINKYLKVAEVYQVRHQPERVSDIYQRVLRVAPMDVTVRQNLIKLRLSQQDIDGALQEYHTLADTYYQLAQIESALEKYKEALRYTSKASDPRKWQVDILHRIADIYDQRVDWKNASAAFEQILKLSPNDAAAALSLSDLYFKLGRTQHAGGLLDRAIALHLKQNKAKKVLEYLQDQIQLRPNQLILRERLATLYAHLQMNTEAINQYDQLAELQLESGLRDDAVHSIEKLLSLGPDNPQAYHQLLEKIKASI